MGSARTSCWVTHSHTQGVSPCHFGLCCPLLLVATWRWPLLSEQCAPPWLCWCGKSYLNIRIFVWCWPYCVIAAFSDITASLQIKRAFLLISFDWNCLINEQALICADDHTASQRHQIAQPEMLHQICSSMSGNCCLVWFTLMQPGCERGIIVVLNAVEADRIHFLNCQGQQW